MITHPRPARRRGLVALSEPPTLTQFVLLSMVFHMLIIVLFGTASGGGARRGEAWWGQLEVDLRQLAPDRGRDSTLSRGAETGTPDAALLRRLGPQPEASQRPAPSKVLPVEQTVPAARPAPAEALPRLNPEAPEEVDRPYVPAPLPAPMIERQLAPPVELRPREAPVAPAAPIERIAPARVEREAAPPLELPPREVPATPAAPIERIAPARVEREAASALELPPREVPAAPAAPIERIAPARIEREAAPPLELPPRETAPRVERPAPSAVPAAAPTLQPPSRAEPLPAEPMPRLHLGAPVPDEDMFKPRRDVVTPPTELGRSPHIDREASRQRAREIAAGRLESRGVFTLPIPPPPERESKEAKAIAKATKPDCRAAYSGLGLLAVPMLVANAISDSGCKW